jgi:hypothetical protein
MKSISILFFGLLQLSCQINKKEEKIRANTDDSANHQYSVKMFVLEIDNKDSSKLGFEATDAGWAFVINGITFLDEKTLLLSDTYHKNLKKVNISSNMAIIDSVIDLKNKIRFKNGDCAFFNDEIFILGLESGEFVNTDLQFSRWNLRNVSPEISVTAEPYFSYPHDSLIVMPSISHNTKNWYYSCLDDQLATLTTSKLRYYDNFTFQYRIFEFINEELKKLNEDFSASMYSKAGMIKLSDGRKKYVLIDASNDEKFYTIYVLE